MWLGFNAKEKKSKKMQRTASHWYFEIETHANTAKNVRPSHGIFEFPPLSCSPGLANSNQLVLAGRQEMFNDLCQSVHFSEYKQLCRRFKILPSYMHFAESWNKFSSFGTQDTARFRVSVCESEIFLNVLGRQTSKRYNMGMDSATMKMVSNIQ